MRRDGWRLTNRIQGLLAIGGAGFRCRGSSGGPSRQCVCGMVPRFRGTCYVERRLHRPRMKGAVI